MPATAVRLEERQLRAQSLTTAFKLQVIHDFLATEKTSPALLLSTLADAAALLRKAGNPR